MTRLWLGGGRAPLLSAQLPSPTGTPLMQQAVSEHLFRAGKYSLAKLVPMQPHGKQGRDAVVAAAKASQARPASARSAVQ